MALKDITPIGVDHVETGDLVTITSNRDGQAMVTITAYAFSSTVGVWLELPAGAMEGDRAIAAAVVLRTRSGYPGHWHVTRIQRPVKPLPTTPGTLIVMKSYRWSGGVVEHLSLAMLDDRGLWHLAKGVLNGAYTLTPDRVVEWEEG